MTDRHPITPQKWQVDAWCKQAGAYGADVDSLFVQAYQAGANEELEACCEWVSQFNYDDYSYQERLRAARRPKPPSLKEQALLQLDTLNADLAMHGMGCDLSQIRRAIESLPS